MGRQLYVLLDRGVHSTTVPLSHTNSFQDKGSEFKRKENLDEYYSKSLATAVQNDVTQADVN
jgi:hypothetical protein